MTLATLRSAIGIGLLSLLCASGLDWLITAGSPKYWGYPVGRVCNQVKPGASKESAIRTVLAPGEPLGMGYADDALVVVGAGFASCTIHMDSERARVRAVELRAAPFYY